MVLLSTRRTKKRTTELSQNLQELPVQNEQKRKEMISLCPGWKRGAATTHGK